MSLLLTAFVTIAFAATYALIIAMIGERAGALWQALAGCRPAVARTAASGIALARS